MSKLALVVGIDDYPRAPLHGCVNDALAMASVLRTDADGSPNFAVRTLTSNDTKVTRAELRRHINQTFVGNPDVALFYFAGHGHLTTNGGFVVTQDEANDDPGITMDEILSAANSAEARDRIIILDCCHSGSLGMTGVVPSATPLTLGLTVLTACREYQTASEKGGKGVFTSLVVSALQGGAADLRGHITPGSVYAYVDQALGPWDQRPMFKTNVSNFTSLRRINPPVPLEIIRKLTVYFPTPEHDFRLDPSFEFTEESAVEGNVEIFKHLQKFHGVGLVRPVGEEHMYFAAMKSLTCGLTALGHHYWRLVKEGKI